MPRPLTPSDLRGLTGLRSSGLMRTHQQTGGVRHEEFIAISGHGVDTGWRDVTSSNDPSGHGSGASTPASTTSTPLRLKR